MPANLRRKGPPTFRDHRPCCRGLGCVVLEAGLPARLEADMERTSSSLHGVLTDCVRSATAAPSLHNSQPWLFRVTGRSVRLYADSRRRLDVLDPHGREMLISVGAALFTLRVALQGAGYVPHTAVLPDPAEPELVATVTAGEPAAPAAGIEALVAAIPRRHTNRRPFAPSVVPADAV